jgi:peptide chain release factor 2
MLFSMYSAWARRASIQLSIVESSLNKDGNPRSVTAIATGAYTRLRQEHGVHRLTRVSPYDSSSRRQTSFASVQVLPDIPVEDADFHQKDIRIETFRAGGKGGQHQQKNETAVRAIHEPTGISAKSTNHRSQSMNRSTAMRVLRAKVAALNREQHEVETSKLRQKRPATFGNQIRSYVLPRDQVLDHRSGKKHRDVLGILAGKTKALGF